MKYYKQLNESGVIVALLTYDFEPKITDPLTVEITAEEYEAISAESREKSRLTNLLYRRKITLEAIPEAWRDEISARVEMMKARKKRGGESN
mgnify:CR=1 FL=1